MAVIAQCLSCRALIAVERMLVDGDRAGFRCSSCLAVSWLPVERAAVTALPAPSPLPVVSELPAAAIVDLPLPALAPAATTAIVPAPAVAVVSAASSFDSDVLERISARLLPPAEEAPRQIELANRFLKLLTQWHNDTEHKQLLKAAAASDELAFVGSRYRAVLDVVRDEPRARAAQQELITLAMATMSSNRALTAPNEQGSSNTIKVAIAVVLVLASALALGVAVKKMVASVDKASAPE